MRFASIGSGSRGNATIIQHGKTTLMVDCGFSARETEKRLQRLGLDAGQLTALLVTHEHADHVNGIRVLARRYQLPIYATPGSAGCLSADVQAQIREIGFDESFAINDIGVTPFAVPHDAREPSQFVFESGQHKVGLLTDTGSITPIIEATLNDCDALMLEANHDAEMLERGEYPDHLKYRVGGRFGHLNNAQSAALLERINTQKLQHILAMHLSEKNNSPEIVAPLFANVLNCQQDWIGIANQDTGFGWRQTL
ncbi:MAG: MBL fold metallo-hydrolase [Methylophaga sp.]|nr:MBL fold metallo-hydrolase [Methylophaga sp.]